MNSMTKLEKAFLVGLAVSVVAIMINFFFSKANTGTGPSISFWIDCVAGVLAVLFIFAFVTAYLMRLNDTDQKPRL